MDIKGPGFFLESSENKNKLQWAPNPQLFILTSVVLDLWRTVVKIFIPTDPGSVDQLFPVTSSSLSVRGLIRGRKSSDIYIQINVSELSAWSGEREMCLMFYSQHIKMLIQVLTFVLFQYNLICFYLGCSLNEGTVLWTVVVDSCSFLMYCNSRARHLTPGFSKGTVHQSSAVYFK